MKESDQTNNKPGKKLFSTPLARIGELFIVFLLALIFIKFISPLAGENLVLKQVIVWVANVLMLLLVWAGLKLRGETWKDFGLSIRFISWKNTLKVFLLSLLVFVLAILGFILGSIIMANITGIPETADMSGYDYLKDNPVLFLLSLAGIYIVSSFGEEVIYRAFLINRITQLRAGSRAMTIFAVVISAIVFGLIHYEWGPMGIVQTGLMGLVLGICYILLKKRLVILILAHAYMDTILMVQIYLNSN